MDAFQAFSHSAVLFKALAPAMTAQLMAAAADMALIIDRSGVVKDLAFRNPRLQKDLKSASSWLGRLWIDTVTVESRPKVEALLDEAARARGPHLRHLNHPSAEGIDVAIQYAAVGIDGNGMIAAFGNDLRPLSALQQRLVEAQQSLERDYTSLRQAQQRYRLLFDTSLDPLIVLDAASLKVVEINAAAREIAGPVNTRAWSFSDMFEIQDRAAVGRFLATMRVSGRADALRLRLAGSSRDGAREMSRDGALEMTISASLLHEDDGTLLLVRLSLAAPLANLSVSTLNGRLLTALEQAPDGFVFTDEHGTVMAANAAFLNMAQLASLDQARGRKLADWLGRAGMEVDMDVLIANLRSRGSVRLYTTELRGQYGLETSVEISAVTVRGSEPAAYGFAIRDVARRIAANDQRQMPDLGRSPEQLVELIGRVSLKDLVRDATDVIERLCIEAALKLSGDNRASAAEMLGLSRQSLYVKLRRYGLGDLDDDPGEDGGARESNPRESNPRESNPRESNP